MLFDDTFRIGGGGSMHADCEMILCGPDHDTGLDACELPEEHELSLKPLPGNDWRPAGPVGDRSGELVLEPLPGSILDTLFRRS